MNNLPEGTDCKTTAPSGQRQFSMNNLPKWTTCKATVPSGLRQFLTPWGQWPWACMNNLRIVQTICQNELPAEQQYHQVWDSCLPPKDGGCGLAGFSEQSAKMNYLQNNNTIRSEAVAYPWGQRLWACRIVWTIWWACRIAWTIWWACSIVWTICQTELPAKQQHHQVWGSCLPRGQWLWARRTVQTVWWACRIVWKIRQNELPAEQWH